MSPMEGFADRLIALMRKIDVASDQEDYLEEVKALAEEAGSKEGLRFLVNKALEYELMNTVVNGKPLPKKTGNGPTMHEYLDRLD